MPWSGSRSTHRRSLAHRANHIVNEGGLYTDVEAWDAVTAPEDMVWARGLVTTEQADTERHAVAVAVLMGHDATP